jgi:glycosyltransferase involved in cell wall biosynthesis
LFSQSDIQGRNKAILDSIQSGHPIVFSSEDALRDFRTFYDTTAEVKSYIYHFAVSIPKYNSSMREEVFKKYEIQGKFFFCANQFWVHKNHMTLFRAVKRLKEKGKNVVVYCSGGSNDYRSKDYYQSVLNYIAENHLEENIKLLGLIERNDQLCLMSESLAIIQPSLFEGWSTSVEEAKALNRYLIISDIPLHREQVVQNALFFEPKNDEELANKIAQIYDCPPKIIPYDYKEDIRKAGRTFMSIVNDLKK